jgi:hypothetical protein
MFGASKSGRVVSGGGTVTDAQIKYVTTLLTGDGTNGAQNNTFLDASTNNFTITRFGNTTQGSAAPFGNNWSNYFNGSTSTYLSAGTAATTFPSTGTTWTVEGWFCINSITSTIGLAAIGDLFQLVITTSGTVLEVQYRNTPASAVWMVNDSSFTFTVGTWYHIAVVLNAGTFRSYVNGNAVGTASTGVGTGANGGSGLNAFLIGVNDAYPFSSPDSALTGYVSNFRVTNTAVYTANFTPPTAALTPITGTTLLTCQSPAFIDNSAISSAITATGTPQVQRFSPFSYITQTPQSYGVYYGTTAVGWQTPAASATNIIGTATLNSSSTFTMEAWIYPLSRHSGGGATSGYVFGSFNLSGGQNDWAMGPDSNGKLVVSWYTGSVLTCLSTNTIPLNAWTHIAVVLNAGAISLFINGTKETLTGTTTATTTSGTPLGYVASGGYLYGGTTWQGFNGVISNLRVVKSALYSVSFTPSTSPLTAITNTSLLTCQNTTIKDNSTNAYTLTTTGAPTPKQLNPFGYTTSAAQSYDPSIYGGSMYFNGTTDLLTTPSTSLLNMGTGDFTYEWWMNPTSQPASTGIWIQSSGATVYGPLWIQFVNGVVSLYATTADGSWNIFSNTAVTGVIPVNTWTHVAITRSSGVWKSYVNGTQYWTATNAGSLYATTTIAGLGAFADSSRFYPGYLSNFRIVKGTALYTANFVPPLAPLTPVTNTQLLMLGTNAGVYDSAMITTEITAGSAQISTTQKKYGTGSLYFTGTGAFLQAPNSPVFAFNTGKYTIECWVYATSLSSCILVDTRSTTTSTTGIAMGFNSSGYLTITKDNTVVTATTNAISLNTWTYFTMTQDGAGYITAYINGTVLFGTLSSTNLTDQYLTIGNSVARSGTGFAGYIDDLRITKGYLRYPAATPFTPPTAALPTS